jgi:Trk K+ transport system NAD-binding subunit
VASFPPTPDGSGHLIACGDDSLTLRVVEELTVRYGEQVTVIMPSARRDRGPDIARLPGVTVIEHSELDEHSFTAAGVQSARALALLRQDDLGNFHAALRATEVNPDLRLVMAIFNTSLGERIRTFFSDCAVLSGSAMAAPSFVASALGEPVPAHVRVSGRTLYVARREDTDREHVVCGLAVTAGLGQPTSLLPSEHHAADLVLAVADGTPRFHLPRRRRRPLRVVARGARMLFGHKLGALFGLLLVVLLAGFALLLASGRSLGNALYFTFLDAAGTAVTRADLPITEKVAQFLLTFDGMAFLPLVTAAIVGARLTGSLRGPDRPLRDHVIVAGLGNVGTRIVGQLHDLGYDVVCVDKREDAAGMAMARRLGLKVVIGETHREETLRAAGISTCQSLVSVTDSDTANLETALHARGLNEDVRIVLRLYNDDLAERVQKTVGNTVSRSVPYLAAPAFAAALLEHQVLRTIPVGRHVLLLADVQVHRDGDMAGQLVREVHQAGEVRLIALRRRGSARVDWSPRPDYRLMPQDRVYIMATRKGLGRVLNRNRSGAPPAAID